MHSSFLVVLICIATLFSVQAAPVLNKRGDHQGQGTFYNVGMGSCGKKNKDSQMVAALSGQLMDENDYCGKKIKASTKHGSVTVTVVDTCPECDKHDIDFSPAAFKKLGDLNDGVLDISWQFD
ncbi:RlpA-like double-psi beta-barrel-protein domain-containing protein-containing protein [Radiomyces spectabilis]|uniref:RlpA-like double-psi beta-barrel-protein domain-containing protein-containing protein n=1 Tax=Radiomyces spectabilis TaxID=64574 RepID=UPI00221E5178|nr:RlpA-like double-psi beta-barrel-protein domain-containing protein-containing protein [Radiomyces spectabilis]KAI8374493.1 RlpA-like double-psi beta-barrel-protein domain-containing protein-containing protein [Radiomyces spectabilis]